MTNNRLDVILHRNQQNAILDLLLAIVFVVAAMTTGLAMKAAVGDLAGVPVDAAPDPIVSGSLAPCAQLAGTLPGDDLLAFADSHAAGTSLLR